MRITTLTFLIFFLICHASAQMKFVHPGALNCKADLDYVKAKIKAKEEPWFSAFSQAIAYAQPGAKPLRHINSRNNDASISKDDARRAYANALVWYFTDQEKYAINAVGILKGWSDLQGFTAGSDQDKLQAGWMGALLAPAAEIMRDYPGWSAADSQKLQKMFRRAFYPQLLTASSWNGNVDFTQLDALMGIAVFNEDEEVFNEAIKRFNKRLPAYFYQCSDGVPPHIEGDGDDLQKFWFNPVKWVDGLTQESCRDNNHHAQFALASALHVAEIAWHQGVDLYTPNSKRLTDAMELMALQITSGDMQGVSADNRTTDLVFATWEIGYTHYHYRMGMVLPETGKILKTIVRVNGVSELNIFAETLTHADLK